jgi:transposase
MGQPRCTSTTAKGKPCKRTALKGTDPPTCVSHVGAAGRKTALDDDITARLVALLRAGNYIEVAVATVGLGRRTFYDWLERGEPTGTAAKDKPFRDFREQVELAKAEGEARNVAIVAKAAAEDWKAAAWMLERQFPERWARTTQRPVADPMTAGAEGGDVKPPTSPFDELDADELAPRRKARRRD